MDAVLIDDAVLPAARHLTGPGAADVLAAAVTAADGLLRTSRPVHVQYRPGSELVVRYSATVEWSGKPAVPETLIASTSRHGPLRGALPLVADTEFGPIEVGVWRWPFDPILTALTDAVTPDRAERFLPHAARPVDLEVVAYRPTERAVVRATAGDGTIHYLKVVQPDTAAGLAARHRHLTVAGVPVPEVTCLDADAGVITMDELRGDTVRQRLKSGAGSWPTADDYLELFAAFSGTELPDAVPVRSRIADALGHAAMLATVVPDQRPRLERICEVLSEASTRVESRRGPTIHGDLYEAQIIMENDRIAGVLDIDDAGPGDPLDDRATVLGHLRYRASNASADARRLHGYADMLRRSFAEPPYDEIDVVTAAVLVGLATGPFRVQHHRWRHEVRRHLTAAERMLRGPDRTNENTFRTVSSERHVAVTERTHRTGTGSTGSRQH
jgi:aminoglycoside phosphotransferase